MMMMMMMMMTMLMMMINLVYFNDLLLEFLHVLLRLSAPSVGSVESNLEFVDVLFQLLLGPHEVCFATRLSLEACLHRLQSTLVVLPIQQTANQTSHSN